MEPRVFSSGLFCRFGQSLNAHASGVQAVALEHLEQALTRPLDDASSWIVVRSPFAGFGKTHLLTRLQQQLRGSHAFVPLLIDTDGAFDLTALWRMVEDRSGRPSPELAPLTGFDLLARRLLAHGLEPLVSSGWVPTRDPETTVESLRKRPVETFDFRDPQAAIARWARDHATELLPRIAMILSDEGGTNYGLTLRWLHILMDYANTVGDEPGRLALLSANAQEVTTLLGLLSLLQRIVLVVDDADAVHHQPFGARRLIHSCAQLRTAAPRIDVVLAMNHDTWTSAFERGLGGATMDRIQSRMIDLQPLSRSEVAALLHLDSRADEIEAVLVRIPESERTPRRILQWMHENEKVVKIEEPVEPESSEDAVFAPLD